MIPVHRTSPVSHCVRRVKMGISSGFNGVRTAYESIKDIDFNSSFDDSSDPFDPNDLDGVFGSQCLRIQVSPKKSAPAPVETVTSAIQLNSSPPSIPCKRLGSPNSSSVDLTKKFKVPSRAFSTTSKKHFQAYPTIQLATQRPTTLPEDLESTRTLKQVKPIILSSEQEYVLQLAKQGKSLFFTGSAGTGKSVLLRAIIKALKHKHRPENVAVTASTGLAACNIGGQTLHSFAGIGLGNSPAPDLIKKIKRNRKAQRRWVTTQVLVIDEISMVDGKLFDKLDEIAKKLRYSSRPFGGIQIIACGDFFQLPPVSRTETLADGQEVKHESQFAFDSESWGKAVQSSIILKEVFRQKGDKVFIDMLNDMRNGLVSEETEREFRRLSRPLDAPAGIIPTELYATREEVDHANKHKLAKLQGETRCYNAIDTGSLPPEIRQMVLNNFLAPQRLYLKKSAQVMCIKNFDETLVNGSLGQVVDFVDKNTYMCHQKLEEDPDTHPSEIESLVGGKKDENPELDSIFSFLETAKKEYNTVDVDNFDLFWENAERKKTLFEKLRESSSGERYPLVRFLLPDGVNTRDVLVEPETWLVEDDSKNNKVVLANRVQLPLMLAWALSVHKAQGQTLARAKVDLSRVFENGQAYVALSRASSRDGLQVLNFTREKVTTHIRVREFYDSLQTTEELAHIPERDLSSSLLELEDYRTEVNI